MLLEDRRPVGVLKLPGLVQHRLDKPHDLLRVVAGIICRGGKTIGAVTEMCAQEDDATGHSRSQSTTRAEECRKREDEDCQCRHAEESDDCGGLHHDRRLHGAIADRVPGKPGCHEASEPFRKAEPEGQCSQPSQPVRPEQSGNHRRQAEEEGQKDRQAEHRKRQGPSKLVRFDQKGVAKPPETSEEVAEAEGPSEKEHGSQAHYPAAVRMRRLPVHQPDQQREGDKESAEYPEGWQGKGANRTGGKGERMTARAP